MKGIRRVELFELLIDKGIVYKDEIDRIFEEYGDDYEKLESGHYNLVNKNKRREMLMDIKKWYDERSITDVPL